MSKLDADLERYGGFEHAGVLIRNGGDLAKLAAEDYNLAVEAISKMSSQSVLSFDTMRKLFTGRNVTQIVGVLSQINGDLGGFNRRMTEMGDITRSSEQAQNSWVHQWNQLKTMFDDGAVSAGTFMDQFAPILKSLNGGISSLSDESKKFTKDTVAGGAAAAALMATIAGGVVFVKSLGAQFAILSAGLAKIGVIISGVALGFAALAAVIVGLGAGLIYATIQAEKNKIAEIENMKQKIKATQETIKLISQQTIEQRKLSDQLRAFLSPLDKGNSLIKELDKSFSSMFYSGSPLLEQMRDFAVTFTALVKDSDKAKKALDSFSMSAYFDDKIKELDKVGTEDSKKEIKELGVKKSQDGALNRLGISNEEELKKAMTKYTALMSKYIQNTGAILTDEMEFLDVMSQAMGKKAIVSDAHDIKSGEYSAQNALLERERLKKEKELASQEAAAKVSQSVLGSAKLADSNFDKKITSALTSFLSDMSPDKAFAEAKTMLAKDKKDKDSGKQGLSDGVINDINLWIEAYNRLVKIHGSSKDLSASDIKQAMTIIEAQKVKVLNNIVSRVYAIYDKGSLTSEESDETKSKIGGILLAYNNELSTALAGTTDETTKELLAQLRDLKPNSSEFAVTMKSLIERVSATANKVVSDTVVAATNKLTDGFNKINNEKKFLDTDTTVSTGKNLAKDDKRSSGYTEEFEDFRLKKYKENPDRKISQNEYFSMYSGKHTANMTPILGTEEDTNSSIKATTGNKGGKNKKDKKSMGKLREIYDEYINIINNKIELEERNLSKLNSGELGKLNTMKLEATVRDSLINFEEKLASAIEESMPEDYKMKDVESILDSRMSGIHSANKSDMTYDSLKASMASANAGLKHGGVGKGEQLDLLNNFVSSIMDLASTELDRVVSVQTSIAGISSMPIEYATKILEETISGQVQRLLELASKLNHSSEEYKLLMAQVDDLQRNGLDRALVKSNFDSKINSLLEQQKYDEVLRMAEQKRAEDSLESSDMAMDATKKAFDAMKINAEKLQTSFISVMDSTIDGIMSGKNTQAMTTENATNDVKGVIGSWAKDSYKDYMGLPQREGRTSTFEERHGQEKGATFVDNVIANDVARATIPETIPIVAGAKTGDPAVVPGETKKKVPETKKEGAGGIDSLVKNLTDKVGPMLKSMMNIMKAKDVEKKLDKIDKNIKKINSKQKDLDRRAQVSDDIQERVALFNEQSVLEEELLKLEIQRTHLEDMEMQTVQLEKMDSIIFKLQEVKMAVLASKPSGGGGKTPEEGTGGTIAEEVTNAGGGIMDSIGGAYGSVKFEGTGAMAGLGNAALGMAGGIANSLVSGLIDGPAGQALGGLAQGVTGFFTGNPMDMIQGLTSIVGSIMGDKKKEAQIEKQIEEHNAKIAESVKDFNFQIMIDNLKKINDGIHLVAENITSYGLSGAYNLYMNQMGGTISGADAQEYKADQVSYGGSLFRRRRRKTVYGSVAEDMNVHRIGSIIGGETEKQLSDSKINNLGELTTAIDGAKKIVAGAQNWQKGKGNWSDKHGQRAEDYARSVAIINATNQVLQQLQETTKLYVNNMAELNSQMFGFTVEFVDEFGQIAEDSEAIVDIIISGWEGLTNILDSISENMFSSDSTLGDSVYEAVLGGVSTALSRDGNMVELGDKLSGLAYEFSKYFVDEKSIEDAKKAAEAAGVAFDPNGIKPINKKAEETMSEMITVMNEMKDREEKLKEYAQMVSEGMLGLGGDIKELRPYLGTEYQTMENQQDHYSKKMDEAFAEVQTDYYNKMMGQDISSPEKVAENIANLTKTIGDFVKSEEAAKETADAMAQGITDMFVNGEVKFDFEAIKDSLKEEFVAVRNDFTSFLNTGDFNDGASSLGSSIGTTITDSIITSLLDKDKYKKAIDGLYKHVDTLVDKGTDVSFAELSKLAQETQKYSLMLDQERQKIEAMKSLFDFNSEVIYDTTSDTINYETSSSKESVYNIYQTNSFNMGAFVSTKATMEEFSDAIAPYMAKAFDNLGLA